MSVSGYAGAGAWGARVVPGAIRRALDTERPLVLAGVLLAELVTLACFGLVAVAALVVGAHVGRGVRWLVVGTFLACVGGALTWVAEAVARWWWSRRRPGVATTSTAPSGAPSTAVLRSRAALVTPWVAAVVPVAWGLGMAFIVRESLWAATVFVLLAAASTARLVPLVSGRAAAGGVHLTPAGLELTWGVTTTTIPWDEVEWARWAPQAALFERTPGTVEHRSFPVDMPSDVVDQVPTGAVRTPLPYLALRLPELRALIDLGRTRPHLREHFGTPDVLGWHVEPPTLA